MSRVRKRPGRRPGGGDETLADWQAAPAGSLRAFAAIYLSHLQTTHYSEHTINTRRRNLLYFFRWCDDRALSEPAELTRAAIERYQRHVYRYRKPGGAPLAICTQTARLYVVRDLLRYLTRRYHIEYNPASELQMPRQPMRIPRQTCTAAEVEAILAQPDLTTPEGVRDRTIMELFYATGIRRQELARLSIYDPDFARSVLLIREGKGKKDRVVPIGDRAQRWLRRYLDHDRLKLLVKPTETTLFLSQTGEPLNPNSISGFVRDYINRSGIEKTGSCHLFRHTVATLMLENGADIRFIQQLLGHANLATTQIYTNVSIKQLQAVHRLTHPASAPPSQD